MDVDDSDPVPRTRGVKRKNAAVIASSDEEEDGPPRKKVAKDVRSQKAALQTKRKSALDTGNDPDDEVTSTKKEQEPTSKNGSTKPKPQARKVVDSEPEAEMTDEAPKKGAKSAKKKGSPSKKKGSPSKKMKGGDKKVEDKQKPE